MQETPESDAAGGCQSCGRSTQPADGWIEADDGGGQYSVDRDFQATQRIGDRINAIAQAEAAISSRMSPPPEVRVRLDRLIDALTGGS